MLNDLKIMLFGEVTEDAAKDAQLKLIISGVTSRLQLLLGGVEPPESMNHIILEVAVVRYNRIGSEVGDFPGPPGRRFCAMRVDRTLPQVHCQTSKYLHRVYTAGPAA